MAVAGYNIKIRDITNDDPAYIVDVGDVLECDLTAANGIANGIEYGLSRAAYDEAGNVGGYSTEETVTVPILTLLLDAIPNLWGAYGTSKLRGAYAGSALRVKDNSDVEEDIGFDGAGLLNVAALSGDTPYRVITFYDQTGNTRHLTTGGSNIPTLNVADKSAYFNQSEFIVPSMAALTAAEAFVRVKLDAQPPVTGDGGFWHMGDSGGNSHVPNGSNNLIYDDFCSDTRNNGLSHSADFTNYLVYSAYSVTNDWANYIDDTLIHQTGTNTTVFRAAPKFGTSVGGAATNYLKGHVTGIVILSAKASAGNRTAIHTGL